MASVSLDGSLSDLYWIMAMSRAARYLHEQSVDDLATSPAKKSHSIGKGSLLTLAAKTYEMNNVLRGAQCVFGTTSRHAQAICVSDTFHPQDH